MSADSNPGNANSGVYQPHPTTEESEDRLKERDRRWERPEHYMLRECLGHDDLPREDPAVSNLARIQPYKTGIENDPIRSHTIRGRKDHVKTDPDDN